MASRQPPAQAAQPRAGRAGWGAAALLTDPRPAAPAVPRRQPPPAPRPPGDRPCLQHHRGVPRGHGRSAAGVAAASPTASAWRGPGRGERRHRPPSGPEGTRPPPSLRAASPRPPLRTHPGAPQPTQEPTRATQAAAPLPASPHLRAAAATPLLRHRACAAGSGRAGVRVRELTSRKRRATGSAEGQKGRRAAGCVALRGRDGGRCARDLRAGVPGGRRGRREGS